MRLARTHKKIRGQGQPFRGQTRSRPRTGMLEAKARTQRGSDLKKKVFAPKICKFSGKFKCSPGKKMSSKFFSQALWCSRRNKIGHDLGPFSTCQKNSAVLEPTTEHFRGLADFEAKAKDFKLCPRGSPKGRGRPQGLHLCCF